MAKNGTLAEVSELEAFAESYSEWLYSMVDPGHEYNFLMSMLFELEFTWTNPRDESRAEDGQHLRERFEDASGIECKDSWIEWPPSVLEVMVGLAIRVENVLYDSTKGDRTSEWFWIMAKNLGCAHLKDKSLKNHCEARSYICDCVDKMVNRKYDADGRDNALFRRPKGWEYDFREEELWSQMTAFTMDFF